MSVKQLTSRLLTLSFILLLMGCATPCDYSLSKIENSVKVTGQYFDKNIKFTGLTIESRGGRSSPQDVHLTRLYAEKSKKTGEVKYYVLADVLYPSGLRYYRRAIFADASSARLDTLWFADNPCEGSGCYNKYSVRFPVDLSRMLVQPQLDFRLETLTGKQNTFSICRPLVEGFILATRKRLNIPETPSYQDPLFPLTASRYRTW